jgi:hypothetical protein
MREPVLDEFGKAFIGRVRDGSCLYLQRVISGKMADPTSKKLYRELRSLGLKPADIEFLGRLLVIAVDSAIGEFLQFIDENEIGLDYKDGSGKKHNIQAISDGLAGELYGDGWIEKFSAYRESIERVT